MRFLLFNIAVIGALAYLFVIERDPPLPTAALPLQEELEEIEAAVVEAVEPAPPIDVPAPVPAPVVAAEPAAPTADELIAELPPVSDPAVEQRRREVLEGPETPLAAAPTAPEPTAPEVVLAEGESLMSPGERVKQLHALAEEMELLFVHSLAE